MPHVPPDKPAANCPWPQISDRLNEIRENPSAFGFDKCALCKGAATSLFTFFPAAGTAMELLFEPGLPLVVTENGVADSADRYRPQFIRDTLHSLDLARFGHDGLPPIDIRGYYHWSLTDNFEWQSGYAIRFGLVAIDYNNSLQRTPRGSALDYSSEIRARR